MVNYELPVTSLVLAGADCLLLTADCLLHLRGFELSGPFARTAGWDRMSSPHGKRKVQ
jgi:hypothetical protein